jgi:hypothetical protein
VTLGQFSITVGMNPRAIQNARLVLGLPPRYTIESAKRLALADILRQACRMSLIDAFGLAGTILREWPRTRKWRRSSTGSTVTIVVDLERFLSFFAVRLSLARTLYSPRKPGRRPKRNRGRVIRAVRHGVDVGLLQVSLSRTPEERLRRLDEDLAFVRSMRVTRK